jgi:hypothetical protein
LDPYNPKRAGKLDGMWLIGIRRVDIADLA